MRVQELLFSTLVFGATALAVQLNERFVDNYNVLTKRQQFKPSTTTAEGSTCADAFGAGYVTCREAGDNKNRLCYNPTLGQTCCSKSWACPSGAFCLDQSAGQGSCCPNGQSSSSCAAAARSAGTVDSSSPTGTSNSSTNSFANANAKPTASSGASSNLRNFVGVAGAFIGVAALL